MAYAMTKQGSRANTMTYEFMCDTIADMNLIENEYKTLGSIAIVLQGESDGLEVYICNSNLQWTALNTGSTQPSGDSSGNSSLSIHVCAQNEIDNGLPDIASPDENTIYLVPAGNTSGNLYEEYIYVDDDWEKFGAASIDLSNYATLSDIAGFYTKPSGGIPAADLAETYLTTHQDISNLATKSEIPDVSGFYTKPNGGIPASDLAETYLTQHQDISGKANSADLAAVATSGSYNDLTNKPTIPDSKEVLYEDGDTDLGLYNFRKTGGNSGAHIYGREFLRKIVGGTVAWNQMASTDLSATESNGITFTPSKNGISLTGTATADANYYMNRVNFIANHIYFLDGNPEGATVSGYRLYAFSSNQNKNKLIKPTDTDWFTLRIIVGNGTATGVVFKPQLFDLTQMFGSTIADAIYAMEQATAGSGVAWFRSLFQNSYYAYDAGSLQSVQTKEHRTAGFNLLDSTKCTMGKINVSTGKKIVDTTGHFWVSNLIKTAKIRECYIKLPNGFTTSNANVGCFYYDVNKQYISTDSNVANKIVEIPKNCEYVYTEIYFVTAQQTYPDGACFNVSDSERNGTYLPYEESHTYPLDSSLILRGIPKWDSTNGLYYDGDEYEADGMVTRKCAKMLIDGTQLAWAYNDTYNYFYATNNIPSTADSMYLCNKYSYGGINTVMGDMQNAADKTIWHRVSGTANAIFIKDTSYNTLEAFKASILGNIYMVYLLATPTTESADAFRELEICSKYGTEEFVDAGVTASTPTRDVSIPVYAETLYTTNVFEYTDKKVDEVNIELSNYVQKTDYATSSTAGAVKVNSGHGIATDSDGVLQLTNPSSDQLKNLSNGWVAPKLNTLHTAVFYALAKAAGDNTQATSDNGVGQYTDNAKTSIKAMLGIPLPPVPVADGAYNLQVSVSSGTVIYNWVSTGA